MRALASSIAMCVALLATGGAAEGGWGVQIGQWEAQHGKPCAAAINIIDTDNSKPYVFGFNGGTLAVASPVAKMRSASVQVDHTTATFKCARASRCEAEDGTSSLLKLLMPDRKIARLELVLSDGAKAGPFDIPLEGLAAALKECEATDPAPPAKIDPRYLNPEPEVAPAPSPR